MYDIQKKIVSFHVVILKLYLGRRFRIFNVKSDVV